MPSLIKGYNYDIFISYRQKDNKYDGWVTEFVENLNKELEATFKEDISVYFDENSHDRLQETHNVDKSLEEKLKCLIFIPILSQTYCDPNSYAWKSEFLSFLRMTESDSIGRDVKLRSGNVASRILPVRIHDLEQEDIKLFENETGSVMRALDFVFKTSTGVIRPLLPNEDHPNDNLNKTFYRDQINKVARSIKEIISGLQAASTTTHVAEKTQHEAQIEQPIIKEKKSEQIKPLKLSKRKLLSGVAVITILIIASIFNYHIIFKGDRLENLRSKGNIVIAVMPFQNMTNDTTKNIWVDLIQHNLISNLSDNPEELKVRQIESVEGMLQSEGIINYDSFTPSLARKISKKLDTNVYIYGNIGQIGPTIRLIAYLCDSRTGEIYKPFQIEISSLDELNFQFIDVLSDQVKDFLLLTQMRSVVSGTSQAFINTESVEAFRCFTFGQKAYFKRDFEVAIKHHNEALANDSNFFYAAIMISYAYGHLGLYDEAKKYCHIIYEKRDQMPILLRTFVNAMHARFFETPNERIKYFRDLLDIDNQSPIFHWNVGYDLKLLYQYDKAISEFEEAMNIYNNWDLKPRWVAEYTDLGFTYHKLSMYNKERKLYKKAEKDYPDNPDLIYRQAILALSEDKTKAANEYIEKFIAICKENSTSETEIASNLAFIHEEAENLEKAKEYYLQAFSLEPENPDMIDNLAYFLIDNDLDINKGLELIDKALYNDPENYNYLHTKGWGLYKNGSYQEAIDLLQKSWDIRREEAVYNHEAYLHLVEAEEAFVN